MVASAMRVVRRDDFGLADAQTALVLLAGLSGDRARESAHALTARFASVTSRE